MRSEPARTDPGPEKEAVRPLRVRKQEFVRDAVWAAAIDLFARKGYDETTVDDIVAAAGTSRRSFFRCFESKSDILAQPMLGFGGLLDGAIRGCHASCSPSEVVRETVLRVVRVAVANPRTRKVIEVASRHPAARAAQLSRMGEVEERVVAAFLARQGRTRDLLRARMLASLTLSTVGAVCVGWSEGGDDTDVASAVEQALDTVAEAARRPARHRTALRPRGRSRTRRAS
jgi:AcrR family transcriptional regulator